MCAAELASLASGGCTPERPSGRGGGSRSSPMTRPGLMRRGRIDVYAATRSRRFSPAVAGVPERVYVPNSGEGTVDVIDPTTFTIMGEFHVGRRPHHITPSWDLNRLYVNNTESNSLTEIDPRTGRPVATIEVTDPYNLYFTLDGKRAIVVAEKYRRLDFRDPHTWELIKSVSIAWAGVDHLDFSADGRYLLTSTEFSGQVVKVDVDAMAVTDHVEVGGLPIDVRLAPDGSVFYVANQGRHGVSIIDLDSMREVEFLHTGQGAHGLAVSRDTTALYVSNRLAGTISVIDVAAGQVRATWMIGGSPDMLQVAPDGRHLWVSGRYDSSVYVVDTTSGHVLQTIKVGANPHGLAYFPQAGRFSIGHNGVYR